MASNRSKILSSDQLVISSSPTVNSPENAIRCTIQGSSENEDRQQSLPISKASWLRRDSHDSKILVPVNDGLWETLGQDNFNKFFSIVTKSSAERMTENEVYSENIIQNNDDSDQEDTPQIAYQDNEIQQQNGNFSPSSRMSRRKSKIFSRTNDG